MGQKEKLIERLKSKPKTFTFDDAESLLRYAFGLSPLPPDPLDIGIAPERVKAFVDRFMKNEGLLLTLKPSWRQQYNARAVAIDADCT